MSDERPVCAYPQAARAHHQLISSSAHQLMRLRELLRIVRRGSSVRGESGARWATYCNDQDAEKVFCQKVVGGIEMA